MLGKWDREYILSGRWICDKSPTGAHYWREYTAERRGIFICKHCFEVREFPVTLEAAIRITRKGGDNEFIY